MMNIQDPRVHMVTKDDSTQMYRAYTRSGDVIVYVVWPNLLLYEDGPLLYKGVAQLKKTSQPNKKGTSNSKIPTEENSSNASNQELSIEPVYEIASKQTVKNLMIARRISRRRRIQRQKINLTVAMM